MQLIVLIVTIVSNFAMMYFTYLSMKYNKMMYEMACEANESSCK